MKYRQDFDAHPSAVHQQDGKILTARRGVPGIRLQLRRYSVHYSGRSHHTEDAGPVQGKSEHPVENRVTVGNENVADPQHLPCRKWCEIAGIEQQGAPAETEVNEQDGIAERIVDQPSLDQLAHANSKRAE
jgi:hypothetical protein